MPRRYVDAGYVADGYVVIERDPGGDDAFRYEIWEAPEPRKRREHKEYEDTIRAAYAEIAKRSAERTLAGPARPLAVQRSAPTVPGERPQAVGDDDDDDEEIILLMVA